MELRYYRDTTGREVDFVILENDKPVKFIECKSSPGRRHRGLSYLKGKYPEVEAVQIDTQTTTDTLSREGIRIVNVGRFLGVGELV